MHATPCYNAAAAVGRPAPPHAPGIQRVGACSQACHNGHILHQEARRLPAILLPAVLRDGVADVSQAKRRGRAQVVGAILRYGQFYL